MCYLNYYNFFSSIRESIDVLTSNIHLNPGERLNIQSENVRIESLDWHPEADSEMVDDHMELSAPMFKKSDFEEEEVEDTGIYPTFTPSTNEDSLSPNITSTTRSPNISQGTATPISSVIGTTQKPKLPVSIHLFRSHLYS